jgi:hypothetical protein
LALILAVGPRSDHELELTANGDRDRTHLRDLIDVGLIDESWSSRYPDVLANRLRRLLNEPNG